MPAPSPWLVEAVRFSKAQVSAVVATLVEWLTIWVLVHLHVHYVAAALMGAISGAIADFAMKKLWVFRTTGAAMPEAWRYALVSGASAGIFSATVYILVSELHLRLPLAVIVANAIVALTWNYPLHRLVVFRHTDGGTP